MKILDNLALKLGYVPKHTKRNLICAWCSKEFEWEGPTQSNHPMYCGKNHSKRASEARNKRKRAWETSQTPKIKAKPEPFTLDLNKVGRCPTPYKQVHATMEKAHEVIQRVDPTMRPYRCKCGAIHIGHRSKK